MKICFMYLEKDTSNEKLYRTITIAKRMNLSLPTASVSL